jgi:hypothetical protein
MTTFDEVEIPNLKNLQLQHPIGKKSVREREEGDDVTHS